jgi:hypothetical protein
MVQEMKTAFENRRGSYRRSRSPSCRLAGSRRPRSLDSHNNQVDPQSSLLGSAPGASSSRPPSAPTRNHSTTAKNIRSRGRVAIIPCNFCFSTGALCMVSNIARRCSECARAGRTIGRCGVNRDHYRPYDSPAPA